MLPSFLIPDSVVREEGSGPIVELGEAAGSVVILTLGIRRIIEQESLDVSIWGSADGTDWGAKPVATFSQKFYCGTYQLLVDLAARPEVRHLRAQWKLARWGRGELKPLFGVYLAARAAEAKPLATTA
ncbi:MAG: hypothetical protein IPM24_26140 [Bryobacterales bacterium]|nr:hypothetical protein [Bryobacterales bacterium]